MSKKILLITILSTFLYTAEGKTGSATVNCTLGATLIGQLAPVDSDEDPANYSGLCDKAFPSPQAPHSDCEGLCTAEVASSSSADPEGPMRVIPAPLVEENTTTFSSPTTPAEEEDSTQTYAPSYQPQEEQTQNFQRSVTQGEGSEIPSNPTGDLKLAPIDREAQE